MGIILKLLLNYLCYNLNSEGDNMSIDEEIIRLQKIKRLYSLINDITDDIIRKYEVDIPLKDIDYLVSLFGGTIVNGNLFDKPEKTGRDTFNIYVSQWDKPRVRKIYALARLGDVILHTNYLSDHYAYLDNDKMIYKPNTGIVSQVDMSNEFAFGLLMPKDNFKNTVNNFSENGMVSLNKIADYFDVPVSAAVTRGKHLGYKWD